MYKTKQQAEVKEGVGEEVRRGEKEEKEVEEAKRNRNSGSSIEL